MRVAVIIPFFNNSNLTITCVQSVLQYTDDDVTVIVVDDGSKESETKNLLAHLPRNTSYRKLDVCKLSENSGFSNACNTGVELAGRRIDTIIFLNNDTVVTDTWFSELISPLDGKIGLCGSKLLYAANKFSHIHNREIKKGTIQHAGIVVEETMSPTHIYRFENSNFPEANVRKTYPYVTGASIAIKKAVFEDIGGFGTGCEDLEICLKIRESDLDILYCPKSLAFHHETATRNPENDNIGSFIQQYRTQLEKDIGFTHKEL